IVDISNHGNNGTLYVGADSSGNYTAGKVGGAYTFDGVDDYIDCGNDPSLNLTDTVTIEAWINLQSNKTGMVIDKEQAYRIWLQFYGDANWCNFVFEIWNGTGWEQELENAYWDMHKDYHIAGTFNGTDLILYRDGAALGSPKSYSGSIGSSALDLEIGRSSFDSNYYFNGTIDEVRIYNHSLSADEIQMHYKSEFQKYNSTDWYFFYNKTGLADGTYTYIPYAQDWLGNVNGTEMRVILINQTGATSTSISGMLDGYYGYDFKANISTADIDSLADYSFDTIGIKLNFSDFNANWDHMKNIINYTANTLNATTFIAFTFDGNYDSSDVYTNNTCDNITANMSDLTNDPYYNNTLFIVMDVNKSQANVLNFTNRIAECIVNASSNKFPLYVENYTNSSLDSSWAATWDMVQVSESSNQSFITAEMNYLRTNTSRTRIYYNLTDEIKDKAEDYYNNLMAVLRGNPIVTNIAYNYVAELNTYDVIVFNNETTAQNYTINVSSANRDGKDVWNPNNDKLIENNTDGNFTVEVDALSYAVLYFEDIDHLTTSQVWEQSTAQTSYRYYNSSDTGGGAYAIQGGNEAMFEINDPSYGHYNQFMLHYEWLNTSLVTNYADYPVVVITDKNVDAINNLTDDMSKMYGYITVLPYSDTDEWETNMTDDVDVWTDTYDINIFMDEIDAGVSAGNNFETRFKNVLDYIRVNKEKKAILNTYTYYTEAGVGGMGDYDMKESFCSTWSGSVDSPIYSWESWSVDYNRAVWSKSSVNPQLLIAFGNQTNVSKMMYCYALYLVLYGTSNNHLYRYAQANFQGQRDIYTFNPGTQLENAWTEVNSTHYTREYSNGIVHVYLDSHTWSFDNGREVNQTELCFKLQHYSADPSSASGLNFTVNNDTDTVYNITYDEIGETQWSINTVCRNITYNPNGRYTIRLYPTNRTSSDGVSLLNFNTNKTGAFSWWDNSVDNYPDSEPSWTAYGRSGLNNDTNTTNWWGTLKVNDTIKTSIDTLNTITQATAVEEERINITLSSLYSYDVETWGDIVDVGTGYIDLYYWNDTTWNLMYPENTTTCNSSSPIWNDTTIDGNIHKSCYYKDGNNYFVRIATPSISTQIYSVETYAVDPDIYFVSPTPPNDTTTTNTSIEINVSITELNLDEVKFNWNGTNYTLFNDSLVLMMNFDNVSALGENDTHVADLSGNGNNGTVVGGNTTTADGKYQRAMMFDGNDDYVQMAYDSSLNITKEITISAWVYVVGTDSQDRVARRAHSLGSDIDDWGLYCNDNAAETLCYVQFRATDCTLTYFDFGTEVNSPVQLNEWTHITATYNDAIDTVRIYVNGFNTETNPTFTGSICGSNNFTEIGGSSTHSLGRWFNGTIDEVRIWNRSLSSSEIQQLYFMNLNKYDTDKWALYVNQSKNSINGLDNGIYTYFASAKDSSGNENQTEVRTITVNATVDETLPLIYLESPTNNTQNTTDNTPDFTFNVTDETASTLNCVLWLDSGTAVAYDSNSSVLNATSTTLTANATLTNDDYWWWVNCSDGTNTNISEKRNISINVSSVTAQDIDNNIDEGSITNVVTVATNELNMSLVPDGGVGQTWWFYFNVTDNALNQEVIFHIINIDEVTPSAWDYPISVQPVYSYDGVIWNRITDTSLSSPVFTFTQQFTQNSVLVALVFPHTYTGLQTYLDTIDGLSFVNRTNIGNSTQNRYIDLLTITNTSVSECDKKVVWVIAGQHPGETPGRHVVQGLIEFLVNETNETSKELRNNYIWKIIPMLNPDGVYTGKCRIDTDGSDLNREWDDVVKGDEVGHAYDEITDWLDNHSIDLLLDFHSHYNDTLVYTLPLAYVTPKYYNNQDRLRSYFQTHTFFDTPYEASTQETLRVEMYDEFGFQTTTLEVNTYNNTYTLPSLKNEGINSALAIDAYLGSLPSVTLLSPGNSSTDNDGNITFVYNVTAYNDIDNCSLYTNTTGDWELNQTNSSIQKSQNNTFIINNLGEGNYLWNVICYDNNSNLDWGNNNKTFTVNATADETLPHIYLESPTNNTQNTTDNTPDFTFNVTDETASTLDCTLWLDNGTAIAYDSNTSVLNATTTTLTANATLTNDDYWWWVNCSDGTNTNISEKRNISINVSGVTAP
ncbi:hypothetical protein GQ472_02500, partial [archaeon]|nr:hypothetical protein [archaeon]